MGAEWAVERQASAAYEWTKAAKRARNTSRCPVYSAHRTACSSAPSWPTVRNKNENLCAAYLSAGVRPVASLSTRTLYLNAARGLAEACFRYSYCCCCSRSSSSCFCLACLPFLTVCPGPLRRLFICTFSYALKYNKAALQHLPLAPAPRWKWNARLNEKYLK